MDAKLLGFEDSTGCINYRPKNISAAHKQKTFQGVPDSVRGYAKDLAEKNWKFYAVNQTRGFCLYSAKTIAIPTWVIDTRSLEEKIWYISHELAHAYAGPTAKHGPDFMEWLKIICPAHCIHFELGYKPRNAAQAGIRKPGDVDTFDLMDF